MDVFQHEVRGGGWDRLTGGGGFGRDSWLVGRGLGLSFLFGLPGILAAIAGTITSGFGIFQNTV